MSGARFLRSTVSIELLAILSGWFVFPFTKQNHHNLIWVVFFRARRFAFSQRHIRRILPCAWFPVAEIGHEILKLFFATKQTPFYFGVGGWTIPSESNQDIFTKFRVENQSVLDFAFRFNVLLGSFSSLWRTQLHFDLVFSLATKSLTQNRRPSETIGGRMKRTKIGY